MKPKLNILLEFPDPDKAWLREHTRPVEQQFNLSIDLPHYLLLKHRTPNEYACYYGDTPPYIRWNPCSWALPHHHRKEILIHELAHHICVVKYDRWDHYSTWRSVFRDLGGSGYACPRFPLPVKEYHRGPCWTKILIKQAGMWCYSDRPMAGAWAFTLPIPCWKRIDVQIARDTFSVDMWKTCGIPLWDIDET
jgi:predicted SprT family Zn-dependent metalloprotease